MTPTSRIHHRQTPEIQGPHLSLKCCWSCRRATLPAKKQNWCIQSSRFWWAAGLICWYSVSILDELQICLQPTKKYAYLEGRVEPRWTQVNHFPMATDVPKCATKTLHVLTPTGEDIELNLGDVFMDIFQGDCFDADGIIPYNTHFC